MARSTSQRATRLAVEAQAVQAVLVCAELADRLDLLTLGASFGGHRLPLYAQPLMIRMIPTIGVPVERITSKKLNINGIV